MLNRVFPGDRSDWLCRAAAAAFVLAVLLDGAGRVLHQPAVWRAGGHFWWTALGLGGVTWIALLFEPARDGRRRGALLVLSALALAALVRWVRGSAGVPADPPLLAAELVSAVLMLSASWRRRRRGMRRAESALSGNLP